MSLGAYICTPSGLYLCGDGVGDSSELFYEHVPISAPEEVERTATELRHVPAQACIGAEAPQASRKRPRPSKASHLIAGSRARQHNVCRLCADVWHAGSHEFNTDHCVQISGCVRQCITLR